VFIQKANDLWDEFTTGSKSKKAKELSVDKRQPQKEALNEKGWKVGTKPP